MIEPEDRDDLCWDRSRDGRMLACAVEPEAELETFDDDPDH